MEKTKRTIIVEEKETDFNLCDELREIETGIKSAQQSYRKAILEATDNFNEKIKNLQKRFKKLEGKCIKFGKINGFVTEVDFYMPNALSTSARMKIQITEDDGKQNIFSMPLDDLIKKLEEI